MDFTAFQRAAERRELPPVILVHGPDQQLIDDALALAARVLLGRPGAEVFDRDVFDGASADVESVVNAALTLPVVADTRLVAVRRCDALPATARDALARYVARPNPSSRLLLLAATSLAESRERRAHWLLAVVPGAATVALVQRRGRALEEWVRQRASAEGVAVTEEAARLLVQFVGEDPLALLGEIRKAALAGGPDNARVDRAEVAAVVGEQRVAGLFDLTDEVVKGDVGRALATVERLLATEEPMAVLAVLAREVRMVWTVKAARDRGQPLEQVARALRRPPAVIQRLAASPIGEGTEVAARLWRCWEVEQRLKSGGEPRAELAALVAELCGVRAAPSRRGR
jgi:DNA polymerase-3 subunit delta